MNRKTAMKVLTLIVVLATTFSITSSFAISASPREEVAVTEDHEAIPSPGACPVSPPPSEPDGVLCGEKRMLQSDVECNPPGSACVTVGQECNSDCKCVQKTVTTPTTPILTPVVPLNCFKLTLEQPRSVLTFSVTGSSGQSTFSGTVSEDYSLTLQDGTIPLFAQRISRGFSGADGAGASYGISALGNPPTQQEAVVSGFGSGGVGGSRDDAIAVATAQFTQARELFLNDVRTALGFDLCP